MRSLSLEWWVERIKNGPFSLARYGDGELYCMWGKQGQNSNGCLYTSKLRKDLLATMTPRLDFYHGLQRVLPHDRIRAEQQWPQIDWYDSEVFGEAVAAGKLFPLIEQLRKMKTAIIGNATLLPIKELIGSMDFITVPKSNSHEVKKFVYCSIKRSEADVFLFSCGMAANVFVSELHNGKRYFLDLGHIWDPLVGSMSRCDLEKVDKETIEKNLCPLEQ